ncbi:hypothetical protein MPSEU_000021500 [Mayamaea pseudoterrestris]|nr:hypothetical protein MPSEU_000021500 [Mayamaea pseudoterrestris]
MRSDSHSPWTVSRERRHCDWYEVIIYYKESARSRTSLTVYATSPLPMFGNTNNTPFGSSGGGFGAPANTGGAFGAGAPSLFGQPQQQQQQQQPAFGGTAFGQPQQNAGGFGAPQQQPMIGGGFGASTNTGFGGGFGQQQQQQPQSSPFGNSFGSPSPAPAQTSLFGGGSTTNMGFGATTSAGTSGGFGATTNTGTSGGFGATFGAPASGGGIFGSAPAPSGGGLFGSAPAASGGLFGAAPASSGGLFGAAPSTGSTFGQPTQQQQPPNTGFGSSTFGATTQPASTFGTSGGFGTSLSSPQANTFGAPAPQGGGLFGAAQAPIGGTSFFSAPSATAAAPAMGQQVPGTRSTQFRPFKKQDGNSSIDFQSITAMPQYENYSFEELRLQDVHPGLQGPVQVAATTPTASNTQGTAFGFGSTPAPAIGFGAAPQQQQQQGGGLFNATAPTPSTGGFFGAQPAPSTTSFGFGTAPQPASFATNAAAPSGGLFGQQQGQATFGATPSSAPAGFGQPTGQAANAFSLGGQPTTQPIGTGGFGTNTNTAGLFGSNAPLFGTNTTATAPPTFGAPASPFGAGGTFSSQPTAQGMSSFSQGPQQHSGFGSGQVASSPMVYFNQGQAGPGQQQGQYPQQQPMGAQPPSMPAISINTNVVPQVANEVLEQQLRALESKQKELEKSAVWHGKEHKSSPTTGVNLSDDGNLGMMFSPTRYTLSPYASLTPASGAKIRPRGFPKSDSMKKRSTNGFGSIFGYDNGSLNTPESHFRSSATSLVIRSDNLKPRPSRLSYETRSKAKRASEDDIDIVPVEEPATPTTSNVRSPPARSTPATTNTTATPGDAKTNHRETTAALESPVLYDYYQQIINADNPGEVSAAAKTKTNATRRISLVVPRLTKPGYTMSPSEEELATKSDADLATVAHFSVQREGVGKVEWIGEVDVRGANLDDIVEINHGDISVYAKAEAENNKPEMGSKLNRPALLTFSGMFPPVSKVSRKSQDAREASFEKKLKKSADAAGAQFISYDGTLGEWKIKVQHFSRYSICDDSDSEGELADECPLPVETPRQPGKTRSLLNPKVTPGMSSRNVVPSDSVVYSEEEYENAATGDSEFVAMDIETAAKEAYAKVYAMVSNAPGPSAVAKQVSFEDDGVMDDDNHAIDRPAVVAPTSRELLEAEASLSTYAMLARQVSPAAPFRKPMGTSMRVAWHCDGSFLKPFRSFAGSGTVVLVKSSPVLNADNAFTNATKALSVHRDSSKRTTKAHGVSFFSLPQTNDGPGLSVELIDALAELATNNDVSSSFGLLADLLRVNTTSSYSDDEAHLPDEARRVFALSQALARLCKEDTGANSSINTTFSALISGDIQGATRFAADQGNWDLVDCITSHAVADYVSPQVGALADGGLFPMVDVESLCILQLSASSQTESGASKLDWRQRLLRLASHHPDCSLAELVSKFESDNATGTALAQPDTASSPGSILYQIFRIIADPSHAPVSAVLHPTSWTKCEFDFSVAFHMSAVMTALCMGAPLDPLQREYIADSFKCQLLSLGHWPWAVLVELLIVGDVTPEVKKMRADRAKDLILRNYCSAEDEVRLKEALTISEEWKDAAMAGRAAYEGKLSELISSLMGYDAQRALFLFESEFLPDVYNADGISRSDMSKIKHIADGLGPNSLAKALYLLEAVRNEALTLTSGSDLSHFSAPLAQIRKILTSYSFSDDKDHSTYAFLIESKAAASRCSRSSMIKQALHQLDFTEKHLKAIKMFGDIDD